ncbi:hypothetical protein [Thalassomonas sp. RHCl1]|uniref:hypothetical protein n=1 Tax=Thalassomonas sp. RHCl1 TaxID=2995320 RepID=UPI00248ADFF0|nr:hypothetical protein [Thalassomonas sp. RHCl1]
MKNAFISCITIFMFALGFQAKATLLTFDDIPGGSIQNSYTEIYSYKGFVFNYTLNWIDVVDSPWNHGAHSGEFAMLNDHKGMGIISQENGDDFIFDGLWAKQYPSPPNSGGPDGLFGTMKGYNNGNLVWEVDTALNGSYKYFEAQQGAIDELHLDFGIWFLVDDLSLTGTGDNNDPQAVSEPAPALLFGMSMFALLLMRRREFFS